MKNASKPLTYEEFIKLARKHYNKGGDTYFECWSKKEWDFYTSNFGSVTEQKALKMFRDSYEIDREHKAAAEWYGGDEYIREVACYE